LSLLETGDGVHRAGALAPDRGDMQPLVPEQPVEHAPSEGAVETGALQGEP
jgi:hypothetical protein